MFRIFKKPFMICWILKEMVHMMYENDDACNIAMEIIAMDLKADAVTVPTCLSAVLEI